MTDPRGRMVRAVGMTHTFLSPTQVDELVAMYQAGATLVEVGERFSVHRRTAAAHLVRRSVPIRSRGLDECHLAEAVELYVGGCRWWRWGRGSGSASRPSDVHSPRRVSRFGQVGGGLRSVRGVPAARV